MVWLARLGAGVEESNEYESLAFVPKNRYSEVLDGQNELIFCTRGTRHILKKTLQRVFKLDTKKNNIKIFKKIKNKY